MKSVVAVAAWRATTGGQDGDNDMGAAMKTDRADAAAINRSADGTRVRGIFLALVLAVGCAAFAVPAARRR